MKIQSRFKDYYDYVEFLYSPEGGSNRDLYVRDGELPSSIILPDRYSIPHYPQPNYSYNHKYTAKRWRQFPWFYKWVAICGKLYLLVADRGDVSLDVVGGSIGFSKSDGFKVVSSNHPSLQYAVFGRWSFRDKCVNFYDVIGIPSPTCMEISKQIGSPVFIIERAMPIGKKLQVELWPEIPNLGSLGFPSLIGAEQMYQDISMFMNQIKENPDSAPPIDVSDKDRLVQKGFDAKVSFRGR